MATKKTALKRVAERISKTELSLKDETIKQLDRGYDFMVERIAELELALEDIGYMRLSAEGDREFSRAGLRTINRLARLYFLKNPLIRRAVLTQTQYVFGQGVEIQAVHPEVNDVVQAFLDDEKNKVELTDHQSIQTKENELQLEANIFFVFFINKINGRVRLRTIPFAEIEEIVTDPEDNKTPLVYVRKRMKKTYSFKTNGFTSKEEVKYYPDWKAEKKKLDKLKLKDKTLEKEVIYHVKVNALSDMKFGVSEVYAAIDWARAYKEFLEDWASVTNALSKFAFNLKSKGGAAGIARAKAKLENKLTGDTETSNYAPNAGSVFLGEEEMKPVRTAGATVSMKDGRQLLLMVSAAMGIFEHYLGDPSTGNLATSKSMERPMEIMFVDRQELWRSIIGNILYLQIKESVRAPQGKLSGLGKIITDEYTEQEKLEMAKDSKNKDKALQKEPIPTDISVLFPSILEKDMKEVVTGIKEGDSVISGIGKREVSEKVIAKLVLQALGVDEIDEVMEQLFDIDEEEAEEIKQQKQKQKDDEEDAKNNPENIWGEDGKNILEKAKGLKGVLDNAINATRRNNNS